MFPPIRLPTRALGVHRVEPFRRPRRPRNYSTPAERRAASARGASQRRL